MTLGWVIHGRIFIPFRLLYNNAKPQCYENNIELYYHLSVYGNVVTNNTPIKLNRWLMRCRRFGTTLVKVEGSNSKIDFCDFKLWRAETQQPLRVIRQEGVSGRLVWSLPGLEGLILCGGLLIILSQVVKENSVLCLGLYVQSHVYTRRKTKAIPDFVFYLMGLSCCHAASSADKI